ncbi:MAG: proline--tRNA ligase [Tenericutes bacterium]|nr:proline--tRNA ligase [Mycoplasmatota bacterium]
MKKNKAITSRDVDFAQWYTDIVRNAKLASYSNVKGFTVFEPNGYAIWENIQAVADKRFKELGHQNIMMPMLIPESLLNKEADHIEGFAPEVAWVTHGGNKKLEERLCVRPTSEVLFCDYYKDVIKSYRDLPKLYNQWCSVVRWEKETRPFLRTREFLWQEGHTMHATAEEAMKETDQMLEVYREIYEDYLAIPVVAGRKTESEKFAGADYTLTVEAMMYNGVALQSATSHYFGNGFAKAFDVKFVNKNNEEEYCYQTSWGLTTRSIGGLIMCHGDDNGLVLPPRIAPRKVAIITYSDDLLEKAYEIRDMLNKGGIVSYVDDSEKSAGFKFAEAEVQGIPFRIEIGKRELENNKIVVARRDNFKKEEVSLDTDLVTYFKEQIDVMHNDMFNRAKKRMEEKTYVCHNMDEVKEVMENHPGFIKAMWCGDEACEEKFKEIRGTKSRCIPFEQEKVDTKCVCCGKEAKDMVIWGIQY